MLNCRFLRVISPRILPSQVLFKFGRITNLFQISIAPEAPQIIASTAARLSPV